MEIWVLGWESEVCWGGCLDFESGGSAHMIFMKSRLGKAALASYSGWACISCIVDPLCGK